MENKYYAFISYSRKNSRAASYLHHEMEQFRIPVKYVPPEYLPKDHKKLRPIFRDRRDLENREGSFSKDIQQAVAASRYLVVLCSVESASSQWVNMEIESFLASHDNDYSKIVPVIVNGTPGSGDEQECLPPSLRHEQIIQRNLPSMLPDDGENIKSAMSNSVVQCLSYMLHISREQVKSSVDAQRLRQYRRYAITGFIFTIVFAALSAWAIMAEQRAAQNEKNAIASEKKAIANEAKAVENAQKAAREAEFAKHSLEFINEILQASRPEYGGSRDMKLYDAIKAKVPDIEYLSPWQLKSSVALNIGTILTTYSDYDEAIRLLKTAFELGVENAPDSNDTALIANNLGSLCFEVGKYDESLLYFQKALDIFVKNEGEGMFTAPIYVNMASVIGSKNDYKKAAEYLQKAEAVYKKMKYESSPEYAKILLRQGEIFFKTGQEDKAEDLYQRSLEIFLKTWGEKNPYTALNYANLGVLYSQRGENEPALRNFEKALKLYIDMYTEEHLYVGGVYHNMAKIYFRTKNYEKALVPMQKAFNIHVRIYGEDSPRLIVFYYDLAFILVANNRFAEAAACMEKGVDIASKIYGEDHEDIKKYRQIIPEIKKRIRKI